MTTAATLPALTEQTPAQIDEQLAEIWGRAYAVQTQIDGYRHSVKIADKCIRQGLRTYQGQKERAEARIVELGEVFAGILAEAVPFEAEFDRRGGWTRAFLVTNTGGHVHKDRRCSSCYITTRYNWIIEFSGKTEAEVVEAAGERACTICYPSAPVEVLSRPTRIFSEDEKKAQVVRAEKASKKAAKDAEQVIDPETGKVLYKTERGATNAVASDLDSALYYGPSHPSYGEWIATLDRVSAALAAKNGREAADVRAELVTKAEKKAKVTLGQTKRGC